MKHSRSFSASVNRAGSIKPSCQAGIIYLVPGGFSIEHITSAAGVAKGTFYLYFSSKDDVLAALADRFAQKLLERIKTAVAEKPALTPGKEWWTTLL